MKDYYVDYLYNMPTIILSTIINASPELVFDLSRSVDLHQVSTAHTNEKVVAGRLTGLIELGESVTWRAKHFGFYQKLTSMITEFDQPNFFTDEMVSGAFESFKHIHKFEAFDNGTLMTDIFLYVSPLGIFGKVADYLFLKRYMKNLLGHRNIIIKQHAEAICS